MFALLSLSRFTLWTLIASCLLLLPSASYAPPESPAAPTNARPLTIDDVISMESARDFAISPDGRWVAWVRVVPDMEKSDLKQNIYLSSTADTTTIPITRATRADRSPRFSPDGSKIAFVSASEKGGAQIHVYDMRGGEPEKLTDVSTGVNAFEWRDSKRILFSAREDSTYRERTLKKAKDTTVIVADMEHYPPVRLFEISLGDKKVSRVTTNEGAVTELAVSPDGRWVVTNENIDVNYTYDYRNPPLQFLTDLATGERREIMTQPHTAPYDFQWDAKSEGFYCRRPVASDSTDTYVNIDELFYFDLATRSLERVDTGSKNGLGYGYLAVRGGVAAALAAGVTDEIVRLEADGARVKARRILETKKGKPIRLLAGRPDSDRIVYLKSDASSVPEIMTATVEKKGLAGEKKLAPFNESLKKRTLAKREIVRWTGALDDEVEGIVYYPVGYEDGQRYPLIVSLHGGPAGADMDFFTASWADYPHVLASKGAFVLNVNYHGSGNYGLEWVESIRGHYYEYEIPDVMTGIDHLVGRGLVDHERVAIMGWSNGAILAIEACLRSDRFRALLAGAGDVNWTSDYANCAFGAAFDNAYFGGPPWEMPQVYLEKSPFFRLREMKTPTLVMFGSRDTSVPTEQGWQLFRAMQQIGEAPVRFLLFPDEGHGLGKIAHRKRKMQEEIAWLDAHFFGTRVRENEAFDSDSPLAAAIDKAAAAREGRLYGETIEGVLAPETVEFEGLRVGRFEVTRAQYRAFDASYEIAPGAENLPANEISYENARDYCLWLTAKTGRRYRLPTVEEMTKLIGAAKANLSRENNLDRWIGYAPTPDERAMMEEKIRELERTRLLLEEVGTFPPVKAPVDPHSSGEAPRVTVYDLGGNAAEWASSKEGGRIMGLSAVSPADPSTPYTPPPAKYVGFRVVAE